MITKRTRRRFIASALLGVPAGVFADAYEGPRGRLAMAAAGAILFLQAVFCILSLPGLL